MNGIQAWIETPADKQPKMLIFWFQGLIFILALEF